MARLLGKVATVCGIALLCVAPGAIVASARAQEPSQRPAAPPPSQKDATQPHDGAGGPERRDEQRRPLRAPFGPRWGRGLFEPAPEDRGPLRPGEEEELRQFLKEKLPRLARALRMIEERQPGIVSRGFPRLVPRLRHLRRIYEQNAPLAQLIEQHAASMFRVEMLRRAWTLADGDARDVLERQIRECLAEKIKVEYSALELWADSLEADRDQRVARRLARLTEPGADLASEPPFVRQKVQEWAAATDETKRQQLHGELAETVEQQLDHQLNAIRRRANELRTNAAQEVDRRLERLLARPADAPPGP